MAGLGVDRPAVLCAVAATLGEGDDVVDLVGTVKTADVALAFVLLHHGPVDPLLSAARSHPVPSTVALCPRLALVDWAGLGLGAMGIGADLDGWLHGTELRRLRCPRSGVRHPGQRSSGIPRVAETTDEPPGLVSSAGNTERHRVLHHDDLIRLAAGALLGRGSAPLHVLDRLPPDDPLQLPGVQAQ